MTHWIHYDGNGNKQCTDGSERKYYTSIMKNVERIKKQQQISRNKYSPPIFKKVL